MNFKNKQLSEYIKKRINQGTVILCFKILLDQVIKNGLESSMSKAEINRVFDKTHKKFGVGTFRSDYLLRQSSNSKLNAIGVEPDNSTFYIRQEFLSGLDSEDLKEVSDFIENYYNEISQEQQEFLNRLNDALLLDIEGRKQFILNMLLVEETDKKGQSFEVTAFAILKTFYQIRGFELNRFSTVYSNDGGIDFTSQMAVYQVTTNLNDRKFNEDIAKAPLKNRIFVFKNIASNFNYSKFNNELVLDFINSEDLTNHLNYLLQKKAEINSKSIIITIIEEFKREYYV